MNNELRLKVIRVLKVLLALDDPNDTEIVRCTIESLIEELEDVDKQQRGRDDN